MTLSETDRLRVLRSYAVLDTDPDPAFDRITTLARLMFDAPIALLSLVDEDRQWFKSRAGFDRCETGRDEAFCAHALPLERGGILTVEDATRDPRFAHNPMVTGGPYIRFYAGAVLTSPEGASLGTLCIIDDRPRDALTPLQAKSLHALADLAMSELEVRRARRDVAAKREMLDLAEAMSGVGHWRLEVATGELEWSDGVFRIHGVDRSNFRPTRDSMLDFYDAAGREVVSDCIGKAIRERTGFSFHLSLRRPDGEWREVACKAACDFDPAGGVDALVGVVQDVTEEQNLLRRVRADGERYRLLTDNANDMISTCALDSTILFATPATRRLLGYEPEELVGTKTLALTHPDDLPAVLSLFARLLQAGPSAQVTPYQFRGLHKDGGWIWLEGQPRVQFDDEGRPVAFQDVVRDIQERRRVEMELEQAKLAAEAAAQAKADFLANMSHELRTPLTSILGYTALASDQADLSPLTRDYVRRVQTASRALLGAVNDILDFSKLEAGQVSIAPAPTDVVAVCRDAVELFAPQAAEKDLQLELAVAGEPPPSVSIDADRLMQILLNLVGNAVKFTEVGSVVVSLRHAADRLTVEVRDTGPGIAAEAQSLLFKRFSQVDGSSTRSHGGSGLGLAICKGLAERMGGTVAVSSEPGRGSVFTIVLPAPRVTPAAAPAASAHGMEQLGAVRVLVVDDNPANRDLARIFLAGAGAEVTEAAGGEQALETLARAPFDAVLLDLRMPDLDGATVLLRLRSAGGPNAAIPVIAYTAEAPSFRFDHRAAGFDGVAHKPLQPSELLTSLKLAIQGAAGRIDHARHPDAAAGGL